MSSSAKIDLENRIYARAYMIGACVHGVYGGLVSAAPDGVLQTLLQVYNANFRAANFKLFCTFTESLELDRAYQAQRTHQPGLTPVYNPQKLNFELILLGNL